MEAFVLAHSWPFEGATLKVKYRSGTLFIRKEDCSASEKIAQLADGSVIDATSENPEFLEKLFEYLLTGVYNATSTASSAQGYIFTVHGRHGENTVGDQFVNDMDIAFQKHSGYIGSEKNARSELIHYINLQHGDSNSTLYPLSPSDRAQVTAPGYTYSVFTLSGWILPNGQPASHYLHHFQDGSVFPGRAISAVHVHLFPSTTTYCAHGSEDVAKCPTHPYSNDLVNPVRPEEMRVHAGMWAMADQYKVATLANLAANRLRFAVHVHWRSVGEFCKAMEAISEGHVGRCERVQVMRDLIWEFGCLDDSEIVKSKVRELGWGVARY